jgi:hypothetical protein
MKKVPLTLIPLCLLKLKTMKKKTFTITSLLLLILFSGCNQQESNNPGLDYNNTCTITVEQFFQLTGAEDSVVRKILPSCFKIDRRGDFREFTYYIKIYILNNTEYYDQFSITTNYNNRSVYFTTSNPKIYEKYKAGLMNSGFVMSDTSEYGEPVYLKEGFKLILRETEPNGQKRYTIYLSKINNIKQHIENEKTSWLPTATQILSLLDKNIEYADKILLPYFSKSDSQYLRQYDYQNEHHMDQILIYPSSNEVVFGSTVDEKAWIYKKRLIDFGFKQLGANYQYKNYIMKESSNMTTSMGSYNKPIYLKTVSIKPN